jgi:hypothetical protein
MLITLFYGVGDFAKVSRCRNQQKNPSNNRSCDPRLRSFHGGSLRQGTLSQGEASPSDTYRYFPILTDTFRGGGLGVAFSRFHSRLKAAIKVAKEHPPPTLTRPTWHPCPVQFKSLFVGFLFGDFQHTPAGRSDTRTLRPAVCPTRDKASSRRRSQVS